MRAGGWLPGGFRWGAEMRPRRYRPQLNQANAAALMGPMPHSNTNLPRARPPCRAPSPLYQTAGWGLYADLPVLYQFPIDKHGIRINQCLHVGLSPRYDWGPLRYTGGRPPGAGQSAISMGNAQEGVCRLVISLTYPRQAMPNMRVQ